MQAVVEAVRSELAALDEGLQRRLAVAAARSTLELMQDTAHVMSKVRAQQIYTHTTSTISTFFCRGLRRVLTAVLLEQNGLLSWSHGSTA